MNRRRRPLLWLFCIFIAAHPSCRCCPTGDCRWAWESCPSCGFGFATTGLEVKDPRVDPFGLIDELDASLDGMRFGTGTPMPQPQSQSGGGLAIVTTPSGTFAIASVQDGVRVVRQHGVVVGDVSFARGDDPGRVVADPTRGLGYVATRNGIAVIDTKANLTVRWRACAEPRGLAFDRSKDVLHVACTSGEILTLAASDGSELRRTFVTRKLEEIAIHGEDLVVGDGLRLFVVAKDGTVRSGDGVHGPLRTTSAWAPSVALATSNAFTELTLVSPEGTIGPALVVRESPMAPTDMAVSSTGAVLVAVDGRAYFLGPGDAEFHALATPHVTSVAIGDGDGDVLAVRTDDGVVFVDP